MSSLKLVADVTVDEIALEGMDGLTLDGLWIRLAERMKWTLPLHIKIRNSLWHYIIHSPVLVFYELAAPRPALRTFDRTDFDTQAVDSAAGYPFTVYNIREVDEPAIPLRGSCQDYDTRRAVDAKAELHGRTLQEALAKWGDDRLVVAGTQATREAVLIPDTVPMNMGISLVQYCLLERLGRARWNGESTTGRFPLNEYNFFHLRKPMIRARLLSKQLYYEKVSENTNQGLLLHLPRFFRIFKPKAMLIIEQLIELLRAEPSGLLEWSRLAHHFDEDILPAVRKVCKSSPILQQFIDTNVPIAYRHLHPNASVEEWRAKSGNERQLRCFRMRHADTDVASIWTTMTAAASTSASTADGGENNDDDDDNNVSGAALFDQSRVELNAPILRQAIEIIGATGCRGMSQKALARQLGMTKLNIRLVTRNLMRAEILDTFLTDAGRQRTTMFFLRRFRDQRYAQLANDIAIDADTVRALPDDPDQTRVFDGNYAFNTDLERTLEAVASNAGVADVGVGVVVVDVKQELGNEVTGDASSGIIDAETVATSRLSESSLTNATATAEPNEQQISAVLLQLKELDRLPGLKLQRRANNFMTARMAKRLHIIEQALCRHRIVDHIYKLFWMIQNVEKNMGYKDAICRRSVQRLVSQLCEERKLRLWSVRLHFKGADAAAMYLAEPHVDADSAVMQRQLQKERVKFLLRLNSERARIKSTITQPVPAVLSNGRKKKLTVVATVTAPDVAHTSPGSFSSSAVSYGKLPKFLRARTLHEFFFYLTYGPVDTAKTSSRQLIQKPVAVEVAISEWRSQHPLIDFAAIAPEMSQVYCTDLTWRTFVPSLHGEYRTDETDSLPPAEAGTAAHQTTTTTQYNDKGWLLLSDALLRMPLSVFVNVINHRYIVPGLEEFLQHPVRRHYLLSFLPAELQDALLGNRKYLFNVTEVMRKCCCLGLLQLGPQRPFNKEHQYAYVNRRASLRDTVMSEPGYYQVTQQQYPLIDYHFTSAASLEKYWRDLHRICTSTRLNKRGSGAQDIPEVPMWDSVPALVATWQTKTADQVKRLDRGEIPGDGLGAGGLDSSMFAHLQRNWTLTRAMREPLTVRRVASKVAQTTLMQQKKKLANTMKSSASTVTLSRRVLMSTTSSVARTTAKPMAVVKRVASALKIRKRRRQEHTTATTTTRRSSTATKVGFKSIANNYDEIDQQALRRMVKLRVDWSRNEDNFLLLTRAAHLIICPNYRRLNVSSIHVRDLLHWYCKSLNKTSRACQRRIVYMLKHPARAAQFHCSLQEARELPEVRRRFGPNFYESVRRRFPREQDFLRALKIFFIDLVFLLLQNVHCLTAMSMMTSNGAAGAAPIAAPPSILPDTVEEFAAQFTVRTDRYEHQPVRFSQPTNRHQIEVAVVGQLIHSACCVVLDKTSWNFQLYDIYKQYTDAVLTDAMTKMRDEQLISANKCSVPTRYSTRSLPLNSTPYHLSMKYSLQMLTALPVEMLPGAWAGLRQLTQPPCLDSFCVRGITGGYALALFELMHRWSGRQLEPGTLRITVEIPTPVIVFDASHCTVSSSSLERIKSRFCSIFGFVNNENASRLEAECGVTSAPTIDESDETAEQSEQPPLKRRRKVTISEAEHQTHEYHLTAAERLMKMDDRRYHFFCVIDAIGHRMNAADLRIATEFGRCTLPNCVFATANSIATVIDIVHRNTGHCTLIADAAQRDLNVLCGDFEVRAQNVVTIFNALLGCQDADDELMPQLAIDILAEKQQALDANIVDVFAGPKDKFINYATTSDTKDEPNVSVSAVGGADEDEDGDRVTKLHDYFFLKSSKVSLTIPDTRHLRVDETLKHQFLESYCEEHIYPLTARNPEEYLLETDTFEKRLLDHLFLYKNQGGSASELLVTYTDRDQLTVALKRLEQLRLVLRAGVTEYVWVHARFAAPWLIATYSLTRLQREALVPSGAQILRVDRGMVSDERVERKRKLSSGVVGGSCDPDDAAEEREVESELRCKYRRTKKTKTTIGVDMDDVAVEHTLPKDKPLILLHVKPWLRINGSLNRRCLDRWLATVLMHCVSSAGVTLDQLARRFSLLLPVHVRDLCICAQRLGCIEMRALRSSRSPAAAAPVMFWEDYAKPEEVAATDLDPLESVFVVVLPDAICKLATFIGERKYSAEFV